MTEYDDTNPKPPSVAHARFAIGDVVRHRLFDFRGVVFDIDPVFANSEEWYQSIPEDQLGEHQEIRWESAAHLLQPDL